MDYEQRVGLSITNPNSVGRHTGESKKNNDIEKDGLSRKDDETRKIEESTKDDGPEEVAPVGQKRKAAALSVVEGNSTPAKNRLSNHPFKTPFKSPFVRSSTGSPTKTIDTPPSRCRVSGMSRTPKRF